MTYNIEKLSPDLDFGVRIRGLGAEDIRNDEVRKQLRALWIQEGLVVFTDCQVTPDFHIDLSRCFGELERHPTREIWVEGCPELIRIKSGPGKAILYEVDGEARSGWIPWHMDLIYVERVNHGGILRAITIPSWGGKTGFIDRAGAYERLPDTLKQRIENLHVGYKMHIDIIRNPYATRSKLRQLQRSAFQESMEEREDRDFPPVVYPLVFRHPENGRKILNISPLFLTHVVGMDEKESDALLNELIDRLDDQRYVYYHEWKPTDMVLWDNWRMLHGVTGASPEEVREMQRTTIAGDYALGKKLSEFTGSHATAGTMNVKQNVVPGVPDHVTPDLVRDIDIFDLPGIEEGVQRAWLRLKECPPVFFTPRNGGHWTIVDTDTVFSLFSDTEHLSNTQKAIPAHPGNPMLPSEADPPEHAIFRAMVQPVFTPRHIDGIDASIRSQARLLIDGFHARGQCEFIGEFGQRLPITIFLNLMGLPLEDMPRLSGYAETLARGSDVIEKGKAWMAVQDYLKSWIERRRRNPSEDLISTILASKVGDRVVNDEEARGVCTNLLLGGLDTVASMMGCIAHFLAESPEHRKQLVSRPELIPRAVDELTRRFAVVGQGRVVKKDLRIGPAHLKIGDRVLLPTMLFNLEESRFPDPWKVDFERKSVQNLTFGNGIHRCAGTYLARTEIRIFLEEWLARIPDFSIAPGEKPVFKSGQVSAMLYLPLVWQPAGIAMSAV